MFTSHFNVSRKIVEAVADVLRMSIIRIVQSLDSSLASTYAAGLLCDATITLSQIRR